MAAALERTATPATAGYHVIGKFTGLVKGPTLVGVGGIHGNETAGVEAARRVAAEIERLGLEVRGTLILLAGNTRALERGVRYLEGDLNRQWRPELVAALRNGDPEILEREDRSELLAELEQAQALSDRIYIVDMHTTSGEGTPFALVGDTLRNRAFARQFPIPIILGLEEQLDHTMLEYMNEQGAVTLGVEAGQHINPSSVDHHETVLWIALVASGLLDADDVPDLATRRERLAKASGGSRFFEIVYRHVITSEDEFEMTPGYVSFQQIKKGQVLGSDVRGPVRAPHDGVILLPLYQQLGDDGFFTGRHINAFWLWLSYVLRRMRAGSLVTLLPGVRRDAKDPDIVHVDTRIARFYPLQIFHLLGFRKRQWAGKELLVSRRHFDSI
jgi:succinylglutamate desuccinylase